MGKGILTFKIYLSIQFVALLRYFLYIDMWACIWFIFYDSEDIYSQEEKHDSKLERKVKYSSVNNKLFWGLNVL